jgi:hypothetical protein
VKRRCRVRQSFRAIKIILVRKYEPSSKQGFKNGEIFKNFPMADDTTVGAVKPWVVGLNITWPNRKLVKAGAVVLK